MKIQSTVTGRAILIQLPDDPEEMLIVEIEIECPSCGQHAIRLAGHHLRAIRNLLMEFVDLHPNLCGDEAGMKVLNRMKFAGSAPSDPNVN